MKAGRGTTGIELLNVNKLGIMSLILPAGFKCSPGVINFDK